MLLRINRGALACRWSPKENKFAVSSGQKCISVCYFEEENDWWVSKMVKKGIKSSVTCLAWHPNNILIVAGGTDFRCRVFSAFIKNVDDKAGAVTTTCGDMLQEYQAKGWVHDVAWSPSGSRLAFVAHDSTVSIVEYADSHVTTVRGRELPYTTALFLNETSLVVAGHDMNPALVSQVGGTWDLRGNLDKADASAGAAKTGVSAAFQKFQTSATKGTEDAGSDALKTRHQMLINGITRWDNSSLTTSGVDGRLAFWSLPTILTPDLNNVK